MNRQSQSGKLQAREDGGLEPGNRGDANSRAGISAEPDTGVSQTPQRSETDRNSAPRPAARGTRKGASQDSGLSQITADRPIFTVSVAADLLGLHPRTLRIYEEKKLVVPARTGGNRRRYSQNDIRRFSNIRRLTQGGVNLEGVRIILEMSEELARLGGDPNGIIEGNLPHSEGRRLATDDK